MKVLKLNEFNQATDIDKPMKSFKTHKELNPVVWESEEKIKPEIREQLMKIADDLYEGLELDFEYSDVILTGSLANMNWSQYSDFDLHIVLDFTKVDENVDLVKKYFTEFKVNWNLKHDIRIHGFDVEVYLQEENEAHTSTGIYSLLNDEWNIKPKAFDGEIDEAAVKVKAESLMAQIDAVEENMESLDYEQFSERIGKVWEKIRKGRTEGLTEENGELSTGNIVFKLLRRNGYIEKVVTLKLEAYDKHNSIK
jgi:predicted nucleotidyltransferase